MTIITRILHRGLVVKRKMTIRTILGMLGEILFPHKMVTLGFSLVLLGLLIPVSLVLDLVDASFPLLFLAFIVALVGVVVCLIGCTCYLSNNRA